MYENDKFTIALEKHFEEICKISCQSISTPGQLVMKQLTAHFPNIFLI